MSVKSKQDFNSKYAIRFLENGKMSCCFGFLLLSNVEKSIFLNLLPSRKSEKDLGVKNGPCEPSYSDNSVLVHSF